MINSLSNEFKNKNIKIVSIKPGCIITPFWDKSVQNNLPQFETTNEKMKEKYSKEMQFLKANAEKNNYHGSKPKDVAENIYKAVTWRGEYN